MPVLFAELLLWWEDIRSLRDNPLAQYWRLAHRRRSAQRPWIRRAWAWAGLAALGALLLVDAFTGYRLTSGELFDTASVLGLCLGVCAWSMYLAWAGQGLYQAFFDALQLLAEGGRSPRSIRLDSAIGAAPLSDRQIVCGVVAGLMPPLCWRVLGGAVLCWLTLLGTHLWCMATMTYRILPRGGHLEGLGMAILAGPVTIAALAGSGILALTVLLTLYIALGRGLTSGAAHAAVVLGLLLQALFTAFGAALSLVFAVNPRIMDEMADVLYSGVCCSALVLYVFTYALLDTVQRCRTRQTVAVWGPLLAVIIPPAAVLLVYLADAATYGGIEGKMLELIYSCAAGFYVDLGALSLLNTMAIPSILCWGAGWESVPDYQWPNAGGLALLIVLQLALIGLCARYAAAAVKRWRQERD